MKLLISILLLFLVTVENATAQTHVDNQNSQKTKTKKKNGFLKAVGNAALGIANTYVQSKLSNTPPPSNNSSNNTATQRTNSSSTPIQMSTPIENGFGTPVQMSTPIANAFGTPVQMSTHIQNAFGTPVQISTPIQNAFGTPVQLSTPIENAFGTPVQLSTPIENAFGTPVQLSTPIENAFGTPVQLSTPIENAFGTPVQLSTPIENAFGTPVQLSTPIENAFGTPVQLSTPIENAFGTQVQMSTPIQNGFGTPVQLSNTIGNGFGTPIQMSTSIQNGFGQPVNLSNSTYALTYNNLISFTSIRNNEIKNSSIDYEKFLTNLSEGRWVGTGYVKEANDWYMEQYIKSVVDGHPNNLYLAGVGATSFWTPATYQNTLTLFTLGGGVANVGNYIYKGGMTFSEYKIAKGGTETLKEILTKNAAGEWVTQRISTEFSHTFITSATQRSMNLPNWVVVNPINIWKVNTVQHALIDSYRYQFLRAGIKSEVGWFSKYNWFTSFK